MRTRLPVVVLASLAVAVGGCAGRATRNIEKLLADLASDSRRRRASAERNLAEHGRAAIKPLSAIVTGEDVEKFDLSEGWEALRVPAARALGLMAAKASLARSEAELAAEPLLKVLNESDNRELRIEAAKALGHFTQLTTPANHLILCFRETDKELVDAARASLVSNALHAIYRLVLVEEPLAAAASTEKDWDRLKERLGSTDDDIRLDTVRELAATRDPRAADLLLQRLAKDKSGEVRYAALLYCQAVAEEAPEGEFAARLFKQLPESFAKDDDSRVALVASQLLREDQPGVVGTFSERAERTTELVVGKLLEDAQSDQYDAAARSDAINALGRLAPSSESALPPEGLSQHVHKRDKLLAALADRETGEPARIRRAAASVLANSDSPLAPPALQKAMEDADSIVRLVAATALGRRGNTEAVAYLIDLLNHEEVKIRTPAADALGTLGAKALPVVMEQLETSLASARQLAQWEVPLRTLERKLEPTAGDRERIADLEAKIEAYREKHPDRDERHIAWGLVVGIGAIAADIGEEAAPALDLMVRATRCHYRDVRRAAANGLGSFKGEKGEKAIAALIGLLEDPDESVRWYAATALEEHGTAAGPALAAALDGKTAAVAARSLGRIGGPDALEAVLARLPKASGEARAALIWSVGELLHRYPNPPHEAAAREALRKASQAADDPEAARLARYALAKAAAPK